MPSDSQLRAQWLNLKVVIIEEMSMMSSERLVHLHQRICEIKVLSFRDASVELFAGISVILISDLFQLPQVKARAIFELPNNPYMAIQDIWKRFKYAELTRSERQKKRSQIRRFFKSSSNWRSNRKTFRN